VYFLNARLLRSMFDHSQFKLLIISFNGGL